MLDALRERLTLQNVLGAAYRYSRSGLARMAGHTWAAPPTTLAEGARLEVDDETRALLLRDLSTPLPSPELVHLVNGHRNVAQFAATRAATVGNIVALLRDAGIDYQAFRSIVDFGCGCGRILAGWEHLLRDDVKLRGFDINPSLVEFCRRNIPYAEASVSEYAPPLPMADASVDFAYAASVWTHLSLQASRQWATEFARIVRPGGVVCVSYHGSYFDHIVERLGWKAKRMHRHAGFYMHAHVRPGKTFEGSNGYATFMTTAFFTSLFEGFELIRNYAGVVYGPNPFAACQDIALLRRI